LKQMEARGCMRWESRHATLRVWNPAPAVFVVNIQGHGDRTLADLILEQFEPAFEQGLRPSIFFDLEQMPSYHSSLRIKLTSRFSRSLRQIEEIHILNVSKLVAMGVAVANLMLGGVVTISSDPVLFDARVDAAARRAGATGFSSRKSRAA
jgi:hypothetical protein